MSSLWRIQRWVRACLGRRAREAALSEEIEHHLEALEQDYQRQGLSAAEARRSAMRDFGGLEAFAEECRDAWADRRTLELVRDAAFGLRLMAKHRAVTAAIVATLGLCLGGNMAILAVLNHLVLRPPPFPEPDRLVEVYSTYTNLGVEYAGSNAYRFGRMTALDDLLQGTALWGEEWKTARWEAESRRLKGWEASDRIVETAGLRAVLGRGFLRDEERAVALGERFWRDSLQGRRDVVGSGLVIDEQAHTVVGVVAGLPADVAYVRVQRWTSEDFQGNDYDQRHERGGRLWLRLRDGVTLEDVRVRLAAIEGRELGSGSADDRQRARREGFAMRAAPLADVWNRDLRPRLYLLQGAAVLVLLIAAVNTAGLLTARAGARSEELATRVALGATRGRLIQQWMTEGALLTAAGWGVGLAVAWLLLLRYPLWAGTATAAGDVPLLSPGVLAASAALAGATAAFIGGLSGSLVVALHGRAGPGPARGSGPSRVLLRLGGRLASLQTALAVLLLGVAGLLLQSYARVVDKDLGYDAEQLTMMRVLLPEARYPEAADKDRFGVRLEQALADIPGVTAVARTSFVPTFGHPDQALYVAGRADREEAVAHVAFTRVSADYFSVMGVPLLQGRAIEERDSAWWREAVVIEQRLALSVFGNESPVGRRIRLGPTPRDPDAWPVVVGVAADMHHGAWDETDGLPMVYRPIVDSNPAEFSALLRSTRDPAELQASVREATRGLDPQVSVFRLGSLQAYLAESVSPRRALLGIIGAFAGIAVSLSMLGIAEILLFDVMSRRRDLGLRLALGADAGTLVRHVMSQALMRVAWGLVPGLLALYAAGRLTSGLLYDTSELEPAVYGAVALTTLGLSLLAGFFPARRAISLDPVESLRAE